MTSYEDQISNLIKQGGGDEHPSVEDGRKVKMDNDPLFQPISEDKKKKIDEAVEKKIKSLTLDENVDTDLTTVPGQQYALISLVAPKGNQKAEHICLKIKGVFDTVENAKKQADILQKMDDTFDIFVVEMYKWLLVPPDPELLEQVHVDNKLNEIITGHREDQLKSKMYFEERKRELINNIKVENEERTKENERLKEIDEKDPDNILPTLDITDITDEKNASSTDNKIEGITESSVNNDILGHCPNSAAPAEKSTPSEILSDMVQTSQDDKPPSKKWSDEVN
jgi:hypothetical protein